MLQGSSGAKVQTRVVSCTNAHLYDWPNWLNWHSWLNWPNWPSSVLLSKKHRIETDYLIVITM